MRWMFPALSIVFTLSVAGCNPSTPAPKAVDGATKDEAEIKQAFTALQAAIAAKDVDKIWGLLAMDTQADAERQAKAVKDAYANLAESAKPAYAKKVGLSAQDLAGMTGKIYVQSSTFFTGETAEMPDSKLDKVVRTGESTASVHYIEDNGKGQRETRSAAREAGQWKFILPVPNAVLK